MPLCSLAWIRIGPRGYEWTHSTRRYMLGLSLWASVCIAWWATFIEWEILCAPRVVQKIWRRVYHFMWLVHIAITSQCTFNACSSIFLFENFEWWKYPCFLKKNYDILCLYYDILHTESHNFDVRYHNILQDVIIFFKEQQYFRHSKILNKKIELQTLNIR